MVVFYISAHGFGHASRSIEVINVVLRQRPDLPLTVRSSVPPWLFETAAERALDLHAVATDTGLAQVGSLRIDEGETARLAAKFYEQFETRVADEAAWLRRAGATLVVADVPPLACAAAARAGIPSIVLANFTWDWIYRGFDGFDRDAPGVLDIIEQAYSTTTCALRLPLHGGFDANGRRRARHTAHRAPLPSRPRIGTCVARDRDHSPGRARVVWRSRGRDALRQGRCGRTRARRAHLVRGQRECRGPRPRACAVLHAS